MHVLRIHLIDQYCFSSKFFFSVFTVVECCEQRELAAVAEAVECWTR